MRPINCNILSYAHDTETLVLTLEAFFPSLRPGFTIPFVPIIPVETGMPELTETSNSGPDSSRNPFCAAG